MTTSGTTAFTLSVEDALEEARGLIGGEITAGHQVSAARRKLNLMMLDWINRGVRLWTVEEATQALTAGDGDYTLAADTVDILDAYIRRDGNDIEVERIGRSRWSDIATKSQQGRPTQFFLSRQAAAPVLYLWPVPENATDVFRYWRMRRIQDVTGQTETMDMPARFLPALTAGLAHGLAQMPENKVPVDRRMELRGDYEATLLRAMQADRERASLFIRPARR
jgi:hypothetical protein